MFEINRVVHKYYLHRLKIGGDLMPKAESKKKNKRKSNLKLGKETFGTMPIEECFRKAFEPYFDPDKQNDYYVEKLVK